MANWARGDVAEIEIGRGEKAYGQVVESPNMIFFDFLNSAGRQVDSAKLIGSEVAFNVVVGRSFANDPHWRRIGNFPIAGGVVEVPKRFIQDPISGNLFVTTTGADRLPASREQVLHLECAAVWELSHVIDRLVDHFAGRENKWIKSMGPR